MPGIRFKSVGFKLGSADDMCTNCEECVRDRFKYGRIFTTVHWWHVDKLWRMNPQPLHKIKLKICRDKKKCSVCGGGGLNFSMGKG